MRCCAVEGEVVIIIFVSSLARIGSTSTRHHRPNTCTTQPKCTLLDGNHSVHWIPPSHHPVAILILEMKRKEILKSNPSRLLTPPVYLKLLSGNLLVAGLGQDQSVVTVLSWEHSHVLHRQNLPVAWCLVRMYRGFQGSFGLFLVADN